MQVESHLSGHRGFRKVVIFSKDVFHSIFDFYGDDPVQIASVQATADQLPKELIFIPALLLLGLVAWLQNGRAAPAPIREGETA